MVIREIRLAKEFLSRGRGTVEKRRNADKEKS